MTAAALSAISTLNFVSAAAALLAALFWYRASTLRVPFDPSKDDGSAGIIMESDGKRYDYFATGSARDSASRKGALFASFAALLQGLALASAGFWR